MEPTTQKLLPLFWSWRGRLWRGIALAVLRLMVFAPIPLIFKWVVDQGVPARDTRMLGWFGLLILVLLALQIFNPFIPSIFYSTSVSVILIWLNWQLAVVLLLFIPIYGFTKAHFFRKLTDRHQVTRLASRCTAITIAHRLSTIQNADRIVTLKDGAIVDIGNYASLSRRPGYFQDLLAAQQAPALAADQTT